MSDIVSGLKRRINEAADRLRIFAKKGDDASLPNSSGKNSAPSTSAKGNATPAGTPRRTPPRKSKGKVKTKKSKNKNSSSKKGGSSKKQGHHPWPKYLGGAIEQTLTRIPPKLHYRFHAALDKFMGGKYARSKTAAAFENMDKSIVIKDLTKFYKTAENGIYSRYLKDFLRGVKESGH